MALAGIETLHPDVFIVEERGIPRVVGVGVSTGGFVGIAEKGPLERAELVTNLTQFDQVYGSFFEGSFLEPSVRAYFDQGGTRCFIVRIIGDGAVDADTALVNHEGSPSIDVNAISAGAWGNNLSLTTQRWQTQVAPSPPSSGIPDVGNGSTQIPVFSLNDITLGNLVVLNDPVSGNTTEAFVHSIDVGQRVLNVRAISSLPATFTYPTDGTTTVTSASSHRLSQRLAEDLVPGATSVSLSSTSNLAIGARMYFDDGTNWATAVVTGIDGPLIRFAAITISGAATLPATTTIAVSQEFDMRVFESGAFQEVFEGLSMEIANTRDYFGTRLAGESNESRIISVIDLFPSVTTLTKATPAPVVARPLTGGTDGATPSDADFIGSDITPLSGMFLLEQVPELNFFSVPGVTTVEVERAAADLADRNGKIIAVLDAPLADDEPTEVLNFRNIEANFDTSFAALYYPWVVTRDPNVGTSGNARFVMPPSGHVQGKYAEVAITRGVHFAPANIPLRGVLDLTHNTSNGEQDLLNPAGINVIRSFPGEGIRIWGARTLSSFKDGRHYVNVRRNLNFIKASLEQGLRFAVFELNEPRTWSKVTSAVTEFLTSLFLRGQLFSPDGTPERAFFVKCDAETNPTSEIREGRLNCEVGVNPPLPAEFVVVRLGLFDGGSTVEEELARR